MKKYTYIDLFASCGGLSEGFEATKKFKCWLLLNGQVARNTLATG